MKTPQLTEYQRAKIIKKLLDDFQLTVDREALVKAAQGEAQEGDEVSDREKLDRLLAAAKDVVATGEVMMVSYRISSDSYEKLVNAVNAVESK